jgi:hypothetical protein
MSLMDAPAYDPTVDNRRRNVLFGISGALALLAILAVAGFVLGHGWLWTNLGYEHRVNYFFDALEAKDYAKAYGIYNADPDWQQHPQKYSDYPLPRFTDDWTADSPVNAPITSHHVDISRTDGSGAFGTGVIVAVRVNLEDGVGHKVFMYVNKSDKTMTWPAPHQLGYNP